MKLGFLLTFLCGSLLCQGQSKRATVAVEVTDPGGAGVSRAEGKLSPQPQDGAGQLETASDGKRTLKLKPGTYNLSESCAGFKMSSKRFTVRETDEIQALSVGLRIVDIGSPEVYPVAQQQQLDLEPMLHDAESLRKLTIMYDSPLQQGFELLFVHGDGSLILQRYPGRPMATTDLPTCKTNVGLDQVKISGNCRTKTFCLSMACQATMNFKFTVFLSATAPKKWVALLVLASMRANKNRFLMTSQ